MPRKQFSYKPRFLYFLFLSSVFSVLLTSNLIFGQSGRRVKNAPKPEIVTETPTPISTPAPTPKPKPTPQVSLRLVSDDRASAFSVIRVPQDMSKYVTYRLENSALINLASNTTGNMKTAKQSAVNSEDDYVVFVQLNENSLARQDVRDIYISFTVFTPKTGKNRMSGTAYFKPELLRNRGVLNRRQTCYGTMRDIDYLMMEASYEVAERILSGFNLPIPPEKCGNTPTFYSSFEGN